MTHADDTDLESLAAQSRAFPPLSLDEVNRLLATVRDGDDQAAVQRLVEHDLGIVFDAAVALAGRGVDVSDLYQEGTLAALVAVGEYAARGGPAAGLHGFIQRVVSAHLGDAVHMETIEQETEAAFVRDAERYQVVAVELRHQLERAPSTSELAAVLGWPEERVEVIADMLGGARAIYDTEIVSYLDDS